LKIAPLKWVALFQNLVAAEVTRLNLKKIWSLLTSAATVLKLAQHSLAFFLME
jgi:hypothetical protein